ncbi:MAG: hypothetical protein ACK595_20335, partial [Planctomycetota bacterium]
MRAPNLLPWSLSLPFLLAVAAAQDGPLLPERAGRIDELLAGEVRSGAYAGLSYVVYHGDRCVAHGAFGLADARADDRMGAEGPRQRAGGGGREAGQGGAAVLL